MCVVAASTLSDAEILRTIDGTFLDGYGMVGHSRAMMANRLSYCFNFKGTVNLDVFTVEINY